MIYSIFLKKLRTTTEYKRPTKFPMCSFKTNKKIPISFCVSKKNSQENWSRTGKFQFVPSVYIAFLCHSQGSSHIYHHVHA